MQDDPSPPAGDGESQQSSPETPDNPTVFILSLTREPLDFIVTRLGFVSNEELRLTVARELYNMAPHWINAAVEAVCTRLAAKN